MFFGEWNWRENASIYKTKATTHIFPTRKDLVDLYVRFSWWKLLEIRLSFHQSVCIEMNNKKISDVLFKKILFMVLTIISIMSIQVDFSRLFFYIYAYRIFDLMLQI